MKKYFSEYILVQTRYWRESGYQTLNNFPVKLQLIGLQRRRI